MCKEFAAEPPVRKIIQKYRVKIELTAHSKISRAPIMVAIPGPNFLKRFTSTYNNRAKPADESSMGRISITSPFRVMMMASGSISAAAK